MPAGLASDLPASRTRGVTCDKAGFVEKQCVKPAGGLRSVAGVHVESTRVPRSPAGRCVPLHRRSCLPPQFATADRAPTRPKQKEKQGPTHSDGRGAKGIGATYHNCKPKQKTANVLTETLCKTSEVTKSAPSTVNSVFLDLLRGTILVPFKGTLNPRKRKPPQPSPREPGRWEVHPVACIRTSLGTFDEGNTLGLGFKPKT